MRGSALGFVLFSGVLIASSASAEDWTATFDSGPLAPKLSEFAAGWGENNGVDRSRFGIRLVRAPPDGVILASGWDYLANRQTKNICMNYEEQESKYQDQVASYSVVSDDETEDIAANANFGGSFGLDFVKLVGGNISDKFGVKWTSHHNSKDVEIVATVTVRNGPKFAVPPGVKVAVPGAPDKSFLINPAGSPSLKLEITKDEKDKRRKDPEAFRAECGDGYVGAIVSGADLAVRLTIHDADQTTRATFEHHGKADVNLLSIIKAGGSDDLSAAIDKARKENRLSVSTEQYGGSGAKSASDIPSTLEIFSGLATQAQDHGKPIYLVIYPYDEVDKCYTCAMPATLTLRDQAIRYYVRLSGVLEQARDVSKEFHSKRVAPYKDTYEFSYRHGVREEDLDKLQSDVRTEMTRIGRLINLLNSAECRQIKPPKASPACLEKTKAIISAGEDFDDLKQWIRLPLPRNVLSDAEWSAIEALDGNFDSRETAYEHALFHHWIERVDLNRCQVLSECHDADYPKYQRMILDSLSASPLSPNVSMGEAAKRGPNIEMSLRVGAGNKIVLTRQGPAEYPYRLDIYKRELPSGAWTLVRGKETMQQPPIVLDASQSDIEVGAAAYVYSVGGNFPVLPYRRLESSLWREQKLLSGVDGSMTFQTPGSLPNLQLKVLAVPQREF
ncbi:hypothetical protein [Mesorhizobium sp. M0816]|uniref:hypothetical protein n=1 Tax=Mesorhizobium sp. M0816 TaxID=2957006 RepID=UPI00333711E7